MSEVVRTLFIVGVSMLAACNGSMDSDGVAVPDLITSSGRLDTFSEARYLVGERDAIIRSVQVKNGDIVPQGQVLIEFACDDVRADFDAAIGKEQFAVSALALAEADPQISELKAAEAKAEAELSRHQDLVDQLARSKKVFAQGAVSEREIIEQEREEEAQAWISKQAQAELARLKDGARSEERDMARAEYAVAKANVSSAQAELQKCSLKSPISGEVLRVYRREGEFSGASQGTHLVVVADTSKMIVRAEVDERDVAYIKIGSKAEVWQDGSSEHYLGHVVELSSIMGRRTARTLDPADRFDRETMEAIVEIQGENIPRHVGLRVIVGFVKEAGLAQNN